MSRLIDLVAPWLLPTLIPVMLAVAGFSWYQSSKITKLEADIVKLRADLKDSDDIAHTNLTNAKMCNAAVEGLQETARVAAIASAKAIKAARDKAAASQSAGLTTLQTPMAIPADQCASIADLTTNWNASRGAK